MYAKAGGGETVGLFAFGIYLGGELTPLTSLSDREWKGGKWVRKHSHSTVSSALVLDSASMKYGWVQRKWLKRVD